MFLVKSWPRDHIDTAAVVVVLQKSHVILLVWW